MTVLASLSVRDWLVLGLLWVPVSLLAVLFLAWVRQSLGDDE